MADAPAAPPSDDTAYVQMFVNAARDGDKDVVISLVQVGVPIDGKFEEETALSQASRHDRLEIVEILLEEEAPLEQTTGVLAETPLMIAAEAGLLRIVQVLITKGADINVYNALGDTPLIKAALRGHRDVVDLLLISSARTPHFMEQLDLRREIRELIALHTAVRTFSIRSLAPLLAAGPSLPAAGASITERLAAENLLARGVDASFLRGMNYRQLLAVLERELQNNKSSSEATVGSSVMTPTASLPRPCTKVLIILATIIGMAFWNRGALSRVFGRFP